MTGPDLPTVPEANVRTRILDCALGLISERGSAGTSMRRLASASGVNVATIYHYFPSKADLLRAVIDERRYGERLREEEAPNIDPSLPVDVRLANLLNWMWVGTLEEQAVLRLLVGEGLRGVAEAQHSARGLIDLIEGNLTDWLRDGFPELAKREIAPDVAARIIRRHLLDLATEHLATGTADADTAVADLIVILLGSRTA